MKLFCRIRRAAQIERDASEWVIRCERGLTAAEQDEFLQWLAADQRHGREFASQRGNWSRLGLLADWRPESSPSPNRDLNLTEGFVAMNHITGGRRARGGIRKDMVSPISALSL